MSGGCSCCSGGPILGRRGLLGLGFAGMAGMVATAARAQEDEPPLETPSGGPGQPYVSQTPVPVTAPPAGPRWLKFRHLHTEKDLEVVYWDQGRYVWDALTAVNQHLSDFRSTEVHPIDVRLLDLLFTLQAVTGSKEPYRIVSAFRSPATNEMLAGQSAQANAGTSQVAKKSQHMEGKAIDMRLNDVSLTGLRDAALALKGGGVGYYPDSGFVHVDIGPVRTWQGT